jgi:hypothetical protein
VYIVVNIFQKKKKKKKETAFHLVAVKIKVKENTTIE